MSSFKSLSILDSVAPRKGRVSRNAIHLNWYGNDLVAPRKGRVSRNAPLVRHIPTNTVAPRKGRVSRNLTALAGITAGETSRPARGV